MGEMPPELTMLPPDTIALYRKRPDIKDLYITWYKEVKKRPPFDRLLWQIGKPTAVFHWTRQDRQFAYLIFSALNWIAGECSECDVIEILAWLLQWNRDVVDTLATLDSLIESSKKDIITKLKRENALPDGTEIFDDVFIELLSSKKISLIEAVVKVIDTITEFCPELKRIRPQMNMYVVPANYVMHPTHRQNYIVGFWCFYLYYIGLVKDVRVYGRI